MKCGPEGPGSLQRKKPGGKPSREPQRCAQGCLNLPGWLSPG
jgi:hypothetical protein